MLKPLLIRGEFTDQREVMRVALAEAKKMLHGTTKRLEIFDVVPRWYGVIVVVQIGGNGGSGCESMREK